FECSNPVRRDGVRLDMIANTAHDRFADEDYARLASAGIRTARDGIRWHRIESPDGKFDWSSVVPMLQAARRARVRVVWDLLHFGWPDFVDVFSPEFVPRFERFVRAFLPVLGDETDETPYLAPVNEISFLSFAGGEEGFFHPFARARGDAMKRQLVAASIAASRAVRERWADARLVHTDPVIHVVADPRRPQDRRRAEDCRLSQFAAWDMIAGRTHPELGGSPDLLDVLGLTYSIRNQWVLDDGVVVPSHPQHLPLRYMLREVQERYERPMFIAQTGIEDDARPAWLHDVSREVRGAARLGVAVEGLCLYPIVNHPGWEDDRHCHDGLWDYADARGHREWYEPLADEIRRQETFFADERAAAEADDERVDGTERSVLDEAARRIDEETTKSRT
ncbi:MAG TPA: hypothetical protein VFL12_10445, partial [Thermoanaerobaculia bacterium]|nr:hypothetical protein [Thermoanaerobaculia bacterium]